MNQYDGGIFTGWCATRDYKLATPLNPYDLVGARAGAMFFDEDIDTGREYFGTVAAYNKSSKWWQVKWDDNDVAQYTYWELSKLSSPPNFDVFKYEDPAHVALQFLKASGGEPEFAQGDKTFQLEGEMYAFISVYFVSASDPFVGAYTEICSFSEYMRYYFTFPLVSFVD
jgi:hypothetical protein